MQEVRPILDRSNAYNVNTNGSQLKTQETHVAFSSDSPLRSVLSRLEKVKKSAAGYVGRCPGHRDSSPSLSIKEGNDGRVLLHCHAGCEPESIVAAIGLQLSDLFLRP